MGVFTVEGDSGKRLRSMNGKAREVGKRQKDLNDDQEIGVMVNGEINLTLEEQMGHRLNGSRPRVKVF